jgi:hypothetical protein
MVQASARTTSCYGRPGLAERGQRPRCTGLLTFPHPRNDPIWLIELEEIESSRKPGHIPLKFIKPQHAARVSPLSRVRLQA